MFPSTAFTTTRRPSRVVVEITPFVTPKHRTTKPSTAKNNTIFLIESQFSPNITKSKDATHHIHPKKQKIRQKTPKPTHLNWLNPSFK